MLSVASASRYITSVSRYNPIIDVHQWSDFAEFRGINRQFRLAVSVCFFTRIFAVHANVEEKPT